MVIAYEGVIPFTPPPPPPAVDSLMHAGPYKLYSQPVYNLRVFYGSENISEDPRNVVKA